MNILNATSAAVAAGAARAMAPATAAEGLAGRGGEDPVGSALHLAFPAEADQASALAARPVLAARERGEGRGAALVMAGDRVSLGSVDM